eukprot:g7021.t1
METLRRGRASLVADGGGGGADDGGDGQHAVPVAEGPSAYEKLDKRALVLTHEPEPKPEPEPEPEHEHELGEEKEDENDEQQTQDLDSLRDPAGPDDEQAGVGGAEGGERGALTDPFRAELVSFFERHNPKKLAEVDAVLRRHAGHEGKLVKMLHEGVRKKAETAAQTLPHGARVLKEDLRAFYAQHDASKVPSVDKILKHYSAQQLVVQLTLRYGSAPPVRGRRVGMPAGMQERKAQLVRFYEQHEPSKIAMVDELLTKYPLRNVVASLQKKYGTVPEGWGSDPAAPAAAAAAGEAATKGKPLTEPRAAAQAPAAPAPGEAVPAAPAATGESAEAESSGGESGEAAPADQDQAKGRWSAYFW